LELKRAVFLDRDGVLNDVVIRNGKPHPPDTLEQFKISKGAKQACALLRNSGFELIVVTNQPDVTRGKTTFEVVEEFHDHLRKNLEITHFYTCYHDDQDACLCRKPSPGLILNSSEELGIDTQKSFMVGDRWRDIEAGNAAGCKSIFIDHSFDEKQPENYFSKVTSLLEAVHVILGVEPC
jgi:D-glycero-D-manno-heptose 1,7-bisphosphate phosphatase